MTTKKLPPTGVYVPVPTFFKNDDSDSELLDLESQVAHAVYLARAGITGLVLLGSTGEAVALTEQERHEIIETVRKGLDAAGFTAYPLVAGTEAYTTRDAIGQCHDAHNAGADFAMCLAPGFFADHTHWSGIVKWYKEVANWSPLPVLIYNYPGVTNRMVLPPSVFQQLASHGNIVGAKLSHGDVSLLAQITNNPENSAAAPHAFRVFTGLGQQLVPVLSVGGAGAIDGLAAIYPHLVVRLYEAYQQMHSATPEHALQLKQVVLELQGDIARGEEMVVKWGIPGIKELIASELGFGKPVTVRLPLQPLQDTAAWKEFHEVRVKLQRVEKMLKDHRANVEQKE